MTAETKPPLFELLREPLPGVKILRPFQHADERGCFVKTFHDGGLASHGLHMILREEFYSVSARNVIRGMHFQLPPHAHQKIVTCLRGRVLDVVLDLRQGSPAYGKSVALELSDRNRLIAWLPVGVAHGFLSLEDDSCVVYKTDTVHNPAFDSGLRWDSFGFPWPVDNPVLSPRDLHHPGFAEFTTPFVFEA